MFVPQLRQVVVLACVAASSAHAASAETKPLRVLYVKGLYHLTLRLDAGFQRLAPDGAPPAQVVSVYYEWDYHRKTPRLVGFPKTAAALAGFDVVVLVNVDAGALTPERIGWLDQYVRKGGGLWVVGGLFAFGRGHYTGSGLDELLPVSVVRFHDLGRSSPGAAITGVGAHPLVAGLDLSSRPVCPYVHELRPKPWATVVLTCGARPLLVVGRVGNGRVAAMAGTALGEAPPGRRAFWDWSGWSELVARLVRWLKGGA